MGINIVKILMLHIPKTGGTSVRQVFSEYIQPKTSVTGVAETKECIWCRKYIDENNSRRN